MKQKILIYIAKILFKILNFVSKHININSSIKPTNQDARIIKIGDYISTKSSGFGIVYFFSDNWYCMANNYGLISRAYYFDEIQEHLSPHEYFKKKELYGYGFNFKHNISSEVLSVLEFWKSSYKNECKSVYIDYNRKEVEFIIFPPLRNANFG
jgi:hypothetical protein